VPGPDATPDGRDRRWLPLGVLGGLFVGSRLAVALAGVRYDADLVNFGAQLADPDLLTDRYLETLWYLHGQPPGFNALVGAVLRWSPFPLDGSLHAVFIVFGALLAVGCWDLARQVGTSRWWATGIAAAVTCSPVALLYENWLSYEVPVAVAVVWMAALTARWSRTANPWVLAGVGGLGAAAVLTRSMLHPVWLVVALGIAMLVQPPWRLAPVTRRWALAALAVPVVLVGGATVKNVVLFDTANLSTWVGFNLNKMVVGTLPPDEFERLRVEGVITAPLGPQDCEPERPGVPVLAERYKRGWRGADGVENHNWECERIWHDQLGADALAVVRAEPGHVAGAVVGSFEIWANHATDYPPFVDGRAELGPFPEAHKRLVMLTVPWDPPWELRNAWAVQLSSADQRFGVSLTLVGATLLVAVAGAVVAVQWRRRGSPARAAVLAGAWTVAFVTLASILFEHAENNRIRYPAEPLTLTLAAAVVVVVGGRWLTNRRTDPSPVPRPPG
jgi:hypothetical protein